MLEMIPGIEQPTVVNKGVERGMGNLENRFLIDATAHPSSDAFATVIVMSHRNGSDLDAGKEKSSLSFPNSKEPRVTCHCWKSPLSRSDFDQVNSPIRKNAAKVKQ